MPGSTRRPSLDEIKQARRRRKLARAALTSTVGAVALAAVVALVWMPAGTAFFATVGIALLARANAADRNTALRGTAVSTIYREGGQAALRAAALLALAWALKIWEGHGPDPVWFAAIYWAGLGLAVVLCLVPIASALWEIPGVGGFLGRLASAVGLGLSGSLVIILAFGLTMAFHETSPSDSAWAIAARANAARALSAIGIAPEGAEAAIAAADQAAAAEAAEAEATRTERAVNDQRVTRDRSVETLEEWRARVTDREGLGIAPGVMD